MPQSLSDAAVQAQLIRISQRLQRAQQKPTTAPTADAASALVLQMEARMAALDTRTTRLERQLAAAAGGQPSEQRPSQQGPSQQRPLRQRPSQQRPSQQRPSEQRPWRRPQPRHQQQQREELLHQQLERVVTMHSELMAHVKASAEEDVARRAAADEAEKRWREELNAAAHGQPREAATPTADQLSHRNDSAPRRSDRALDSAAGSAAAMPSAPASAAASPSGTQVWRVSSFAAIALAIIFVCRMLKKSKAAVLEEDARATVETLLSHSAEWLKLPLRPIVQSVSSEASLQLELAGGGGRGRSGRFWRRGSTSEVSGSLELQVEKLKLGVKSVLEAVLTAVPDAPTPLLTSLHVLCHRRVHWPNEFRLFPTERAALTQLPDGSQAPASGDSARLLAVHLVLTRVLVLQLLLRPEGLRTKPSARGQGNLRMLAALVHYLCHAALATDDGGVERGLARDAEVSEPFASELQRLRENGLPLLDQWVTETHGMINSWASAMLRAASNAQVAAEHANARASVQPAAAPPAPEPENGL